VDGDRVVRLGFCLIGLSPIFSGDSIIRVAGLVVTASFRVSPLSRGLDEGVR
jgi:hypothetical protein